MYIGKSPEDTFRGLTSKASFTGDGSTTTFDLSQNALDGGTNDIQVFVNNVRQEPGSGKSYTLGLDGSSRVRRITFTVAPVASDVIYVLNPGRSSNEINTVSDNAITTAKILDGAITGAKIAAGTVVAATTPQLGGNLDTNSHNIIIDDAHGITDENNNEQIVFQTTSNAVNQIDVTNAATGNGPEISATGGDTNIDLKLTPKATGKLVLDGLSFPNADGSSDQFLKTNGSGVLSFADVPSPTLPTVANVSQTIAPASATSINITGTGFSNIPQVEFIKSDTGAITSSNTVSLTNATTLAVNCTLATGTYYVRVELDNGRAARSTNAIITSSAAPTFSTSAGSLGSVAGDFSGTVATVAGSSDSAIAFSETTNVLTNASQANCALNASTGAITTSDFGGNSAVATTYTFTLRITDAESQTVDRQFSLTSSFGLSNGGQFN